MTDTDRLAEIKARLAAATPGPWEIPEGSLNGNAWAIGPIVGYDYDALGVTADDPNAMLVSHAPADIAWLVAEIERLRGADETCLKLAADCDSLSYENSKLRKEVERLTVEIDEREKFAESVNWN
jgi:hypothetical protein